VGDGPLGITCGEVADLWGLSLNTVRSHVRNLYEKLQVCSKAEGRARDELSVGCVRGNGVNANKRVSSKSAARTRPAKTAKAAKSKAAKSKLAKSKPAKSKPAKSARSAKPLASEIPPVLAPVADAFADVSGVSRRRMFSSENAFAVNGKIFAMLTRGMFVVKLPKERVDDLVDAGKGQRFDPGHGRLMKEWIAVEAGALPWVALAKEAHSYVRRGNR